MLETAIVGLTLAVANAAGIGAAGVAAVSVAGASGPSAAAPSGVATGGATLPAGASGSLVAYVSNVRDGQLSVLVGETEVQITDHDLVARLAQAASTGSKKDEV